MTEEKFDSAVFAQKYYYPNNINCYTAQSIKKTVKEAEDKIDQLPPSSLVKK